MMNFLKKALVVITFLSSNATYQKYKKLFLEWLSKKIQAQNVEPEKTTEEKEMAYPETFPLDSIKYVLAAIKNGTVNESLKEFVNHLYIVIGYLLKTVFGGPEGNYSSGPVDEDTLAELYALEDYEPLFGAEETATVDPAMILSLIQLVFNLLKALGIFKKNSTTDVLE